MTRRKYGLSEDVLKRISPPGTRHLKGLTFSRAQWEELRLSGERVWLLCPPSTKARPAPGLAAYLKRGEQLGIPQAYKCSVRPEWWRPPAVGSPDLFFTYMSHRFPRLIANTARVTFLNSMHGVRLVRDAPAAAKSALPLLSFNSVTMLGGEVLGRSYGGGILKMEPREAASLPVPAVADLNAAWETLSQRSAKYDDAIRRGHWQTVVADVDQLLLGGLVGLDTDQIDALRQAASRLRVRRTRQTEGDA